jgi:DNA-directed RNA polymerase subunit E'/Rpb7
MKFVKVKDHPSLKRDVHTQAVINTSNSEYEEYKRIQENTSLRSRIIENEINSLKNDISEIKNILKQIVQGK